MSKGGVTATSTDALSREAIARVDPSDQLGDVLALPEHLRDALWRVGVGDHAGLGHLRRAGRRGNGRLGDRRRAGARRARRSRLAPDLRDARLRAAAVDDAGHDGAVRELLGRHRGDARLLRVGGRAGRAAHGRDHRRAPGRDGARRRRARDPAARRLPAARGGRLHDRRGARGGGPVRRRPEADLGDRRRRLAHRAARRRVGPGRAGGLAGQGDRARAATAPRR